MDYQLFFSVTFHIIMLPVLSFSLFIAYMNKREFMEQCGFDKPVIGMIIVGSFFGIFADIPLIIFGDSLLNINLGGALIPVIVSGALIYRKKINVVYVAFGTAVVALISYHFSRIEPGVGIVSEFPYYFLPAMGALFIALGIGLSIGKDEKFQIPLAYSVGVLGTLIGADFVRIPELVEIGVLGSFGGAGAMDLVYLSGLIASIPLILANYLKWDYSLPKDPIVRAKKLMKEGEHSKSRAQVIRGVRLELKKAKKLVNRNINPMFFDRCRTASEIFRKLGFGPEAVKDYITLRKEKYGTDLREIKKDILTGVLLRDGIRLRVSDSYTSLSKRFIAYITDLILISIPFIIFFIYLFSTQLSNGQAIYISEPVILAIISLGTSIQFLYFTLTEWYFGTTIGKALLGLKVLDDDFEPIGFVESAARNSGRYADIILGFYFISLILILRSPERKRIGDYIAGTRVIKTK